MRLEKGQWVMLITFGIVLLLDIFSTFSSGKYAQHLETNPLFVFTGSWIVLILFNIIWITVLLWLYYNKNPTFRFFCWAVFTWFTTIRINVVINNFKVGAMARAGEISMEAAKQVPSNVKLESYVGTVIVMVAPILLTFLAYLLFKLDHKVVKK